MRGWAAMPLRYLVVLKLKSLASRGRGRLPKGETWELTKGQGLPKVKTKHSGAPPTQERKRR